jgi:hypothetical protein
MNFHSTQNLCRDPNESRKGVDTLNPGRRKVFSDVLGVRRTSDLWALASQYPDDRSYYPLASNNLVAALVTHSPIVHTSPTLGPPFEFPRTRVP